MRFEWDPAKRKTNLRRHGVDFEVVPKIFEGPILERRDDRLDYGEIRWIAIGILSNVELTVCYTDRGERRRIISARKANRDEREAFYRAFFP